MNKKYLNTLEYYKIINIVSDFIHSQPSKELFLKTSPSTKINEIEELLAEVSDVIELILRKGSPNFVGINPIAPIMKRLSMEATLNNSELLTIRDNLYLARLAKEYIKEKNPLIENNNNVIRNIFNKLITVKNLESEIRRCIISHDEIADDASVLLHKIRRNIINSRAQVKERLNHYIRSEKYKKFIQDSIITVRSDRYVIPVKKEYKNELKGIIHDISTSGATLYVEPTDIVTINNKVRELLIEEKEEIKRILQKLSKLSTEYINEIEYNYNLLLKLDIIYGKGNFALKYECSVPKVNNKNIIRIIQGRHPLIDANVVVPIDFHIGDIFNTLVITGPNTGGKTVSLKTVGLFTLMTQAGLPIPVKEGSEIAIFSKVFADIGDEQSIEQNLSTFSSHMTNIIKILKEVTQNSLVLLDELGAGTDPSEGSALALAIIEYLQSKKCTTIATTHYSEIKIYAATHDGIENASCEFDVKTLSPTYKLLIGIPGKSNALYISRRLGLNNDIIMNAKQFIDNENSDYEDIILSLEKSRQRMQKELKKAQETRINVANLEKILKEKINRLELEKEKILNKSYEKGEKIILEAKMKSEEIIEQLNRLKKDGKLIINAKKEADLKNILNNTIIKKKEPKKAVVNTNTVITDIKVGDEVLIVDLNKKATVLKLPNKNNEVYVQAGIMKLNVPLSNLKLIKSDNKINVNSFGLNKMKDVQLELDIRGMNLSDATLKIEKFLDDSFLLGLSSVQIIHGKGTGVLRKGVHDILRHNSHTKSFRLGVYGEGESGVTIVTLKNK